MIYLFLPLYILTLALAYYVGYKSQKISQYYKDLAARVTTVVKRKEEEVAEEEESVVIDPDDIVQQTRLEQERKMRMLNPDEDLPDL